MSPSTGIRVYVILILSNLLIYCVTSSSDQCEPVSGSICKCKFLDGRIVDLTPISPKGEALFQDIAVTPPSNDSSKYSYNPCFKFKEGTTGCQNGVTVCQKQGALEYALGKESSEFVYEATTNRLFLLYEVSGRRTNVSLRCSNDEKPEFQALGETIPNQSRNYLMVLTTKCACPDGCVEENISDGLSTGSVLVVLFFVFSAVYFFGGLAYLKIVRGASGTEMIPNYDFWVDFPLLVRDGVVFLLNCCRAETTYERI